MKRSLIFDGQLLQTDAWHRGMGKYILRVLDELQSEYSEETEIAVLLNVNLPCDPSRFETLQRNYPNIRIISCDLPLPDSKAKDKGSGDYKKKLNAIVNKEFQGTEKFYLLTSLFLFDFVADFPDNCHKLMLFYDLTPLLFWRDLGGYFPHEWYMERFKRVYEAEHIFAISETTREDLLMVFGLSPEGITSINGGYTKISKNKTKPKGFEVPPRYVLFPTGDLPHKNNDLTVRAFNQYCLKHRNPVKMLITSYFSDQSKQRLLAMSDHVIFTNNVSDDELEWLHEEAEAIIFSSKYEGLGMPMLDAVADKKPIVASNIPVFREMSKQAFYFFDPLDSDDLESQIQQALERRGFRDKLQHYPGIMTKYTWAKTAGRLHSYLIHPTWTVSSGLNQKRILNKPRIAVCSLHPGITGQDGRLSEQLHYSLRDKFRVDYYFDSNGLNFRELERPTFLDLMDCHVSDVNQMGLSTYPEYELVIYILDKFAIPSRVAQRAVVLPGMIVSGPISGLNEQGELLKQLIFDNASCVYLYNAKGFYEYQKIVSRISVEVTRQHTDPSRTVKILKRGAGKRGIIKQLKRA